MSRPRQDAKSTTTTKVGFFAMLSNPLHARGTGASSVRRWRRLRVTLAILAVVIAAFAVTAAPASANVEMGPISEISYGSATAKATVLTNTGIFGAEYTFEYSTDEVTWKPGPGVFVGNGEQKPHPIEGKLTNLRSSTKYFVRVSANNFSDPVVFSPPPNPSFTTLTADPTEVLRIDNASEVAYTTAKATGAIDRPVKSDNVACHFEYITDAAYLANPVGERFAGATSLGCEPEESVAATGHVPVGAKLGNLNPATTYHLRLVVSNAAGSDAKEAASTFTTLTVDPPTVVSIEDAAGVEYSQAQVKGVVERPANADHVFDVTCNFEYITDAQFKENEEDLSQPGFTGAGQVACQPEAEPAENPITVAGQRPVKATLPGLTASTTYHLRLSATNLGGSDAKEAASTFTTEGPVPPPVVVSIEEASEVTIHTAIAEGVVERPAGKDPALDLNCRFEYISDAQFQANPPGEGFAGAGQAGCIQNPVTEGTVGPDGTEAVKAELGPLKAGTTFHLRLVAENVGGTVSKDAAATFTTLPPELPTVSIDPITEDVFNTARVSGTIGEGQGSGRLIGYLEMSSDGGASWSQIQISDGPVVEHDYTGLQPETTYLFRISVWHDRFGGFGPLAFELGEVAFSATETITTEPLAAPTVVFNPVTDIIANGAHFSGSVDTNAPAGPFTANAKAAYKTEWHFECSPACPPQPGLSGTVTAEEGSQAISTDVIRLEPNTHYKVKLIAENALKTPVEAEQIFDTPLVKPTVTALPGGSDGEGGYILSGIVNPNNSAVTSCEFKWGPNSAGYAFSAPCSPPPGDKGRPVTVEAHLTGLNPGVTYHADLLATSAAGTEESGDFEFTPTLAVKGPGCPNEQLRAENNSLALPECRAYEMVTDPNKEGNGARLRDFDGGEALEYRSGAPNIAHSGQGTFLGSFYVSTRTPAGWETIPDLNGPTGSLFGAPEHAQFSEIGEVPIYSADLLSSVWRLKGKDPAGAYLRRPDGRFVLIAPTGGTEGGNRLGEAAVGASDDLSHVVYNGVVQSAEEIFGPGVYEFVGTGNDQPRRVDVDNSGAPISTCGFEVGGGGEPAAIGRAVSTDGRVIVVQVAGGCGGSNPPANELWARVDGTTSYDVSASDCDRTAVDPGGACYSPPCPVAGSQNGGSCLSTSGPIFAGASVDGSRVYFTTAEQLVDGDTDETDDLYACDIPATPQAPVGRANPCSALHEVSAGSAGGANVQEVLTTSDDGSTAYFTARGVLAGNVDALGEAALAGDENLYVWRTDAAHPDGQTTFVASLPEGEAPLAQTTPEGRYLVLQTAGRLLPSDTDESTDIYRYDAVTGEMARVSTGVSGAGGNGEFDAELSVSHFVHNSHPSISDNGKLIVFATEEALSPLDGNGEPDAYLWSDGHVLEPVAPLLAGREGAVNLPGGVTIDGSGQDIYIQTAARLNATDVDAQTDVYDARIDGGFPQRQEGCAGEACQPQPSASPSSSASPANHLNGEGNVKPKTCPKGKVLKAKKCVKKHQKKHKAKHHKKKAHHRHHGKKPGHKKGGGK